MFNIFGAGGSKPIETNEPPQSVLKEWEQYQSRDVETGTTSTQVLKVRETRAAATAPFFFPGARIS
jgi:hypothetical protein